MASNSSNDEIHRAAYHGNIDNLKQLLANGVDINNQNSNGKTPLMMAFHGSAKKKVKFGVITFLLDKGADPNSIDKNGDTTLHVAVRAAMHRDISRKFIRCLLEYGADYTMLDKSGKTASKLAYATGNVKLGDFLLFYDPEPFREKKTRHAVNELLSCLFPTYAFHRQFREDMELSIQKDRMNKLLDRVKPLKSDTNLTEESKEILDTTGILSPLEEDKNLANEVKNIVNMPDEATMVTALNDVEKITIAQTCNNKDARIPKLITSPYFCENSKYISGSKDKKFRSNVTQLPHIGNEFKSVLKNDDKIHQLAHIGNESNFNDTLSRNLSYVYAR